MMMRFLAVACLGIAALVQAQNQTIQVQVGGTENESGGIFQFKPSSFNATNGSVITFEFSGNPGNHSVTFHIPSLRLGALSNPCQPMSGGFDSGWVLIPTGGVSPNPLWNLTITDDSNTIYFFCKQLIPSPHCAAGMVGTINAPSSGTGSFNDYLNNAKQTKDSGQGVGALVGQGASASAVPGPLPSGVTLFGTPASTPVSAASSGSGTSSAASASGSSSAAFKIEYDFKLFTLFAATMGIALITISRANAARSRFVSTAKTLQKKPDASQANSKKESVAAPSSPSATASSSSTEAKTSKNPTIEVGEDGSLHVPERPKSWLTHKVETSPTVRYWFMKITALLGYHSPKQRAGLRTFLLYERVCAVTPDAERSFWQNECDLPPTFQSWFIVTNLHFWMLTVRLRALPEPHGKFYVQFLLDHFFLDIEDRIRAILQPAIPPRDPYTFFTSFYVNPNIPKDGKLKRGSRAPERLVTRQMKIFKEQWMGMGMWFDYGLVTNDMELASAMWRNLLGARGSQGIAYPDSNPPKFRRGVNLVGGEVENPEKIDLEKEQGRDDGSGVHDYPPDEIDKYVGYPELMLDIVTYARREIARLEKISDEEIMEGDLGALQFGKIRPHVKGSS
ncbi:hypothetical protein F5050DRAFT_1711134 [Lentinula boryana]|uniref:Ubiquinol-cytochrome c chaperone domain-containing protein n=1 Tax=Lentinula boryana TaxID=40481 RepID=A0ABQ8QGL0_9AGAR|nr:hypothetical protein F5050DRAFT_1711134 [Lentinula boryana]